MNKQIDEMEKIGNALEERLRFESLLSDFSARFVYVSADRLDGEIESALKGVLEFFQVDRCGLIRASKDRTAWQLTHVAYADDQVPRVPVGFDFPRSNNPWAYEMLFEKRRTLAFSSMDDLPPEAQVDRKAWIERGTRSTLLIPIHSGESVNYAISINAMKSERVWPEEFIPGCACWERSLSMPWSAGRTGWIWRNSSGSRWSWPRSRDVSSTCLSTG